MSGSHRRVLFPRMYESAQAKRPVMPMAQRVLWGVVVPMFILMALIAAACVGYRLHYQATHTSSPTSSMESLVNLVKMFGFAIFGLICAPFVLGLNVGLALMRWRRRLSSFAAGLGGIVLGIVIGALTSALILWLGKAYLTSHHGVSPAAWQSSISRDVLARVQNDGLFSSAPQ